MAKYRIILDVRGRLAIDPIEADTPEAAYAEAVAMIKRGDVKADGWGGGSQVVDFDDLEVDPREMWDFEEYRTNG